MTLAADPGDQIHPLSPNQAGLWYLEQLVPGMSGYNTKFSARIRSSLDVDALRRALARLVERHAALRTTFAVENGAPVQCVRAQLGFGFELVDAAGWSDARITAAAQERLRAPFDLGAGPALRVTLFRRSAEDSVLLLCMHHLLTDLSSCAVLVQDLAALYQAERSGQPAQLPALAAQYADFVRWQAQLLAGEHGRRSEAFWSEALARVPGSLELHADRPRPATPTFRGAVNQFYVAPALAAALRAWGKAQGYTLFEVLLAGFELLLYRHAQEEVFLVGTLMSGRTLPRFAPVAGYFSNVVPIRADFSGAPTFAQHVQRCREALRAAHEHRNYPFTLIARMRPGRAAPPVRAVFGLQTPPQLKRFGVYDLGIFGDPALARLELGGLALEPWALTHQDGNFDLQLWVAEAGDVLACELKYSTDLFEASTVARLAQSYQQLLEDVVARPGLPVTQLEVLAPAQRALLLGASKGASPAVGEDYFPRSFEQQAARSPDAVAVVSAGRSMTYGELDRRANQLAHHLMALGTGPGGVVGVFLERSADMVVALLGILKAGAAYMPMDPSYPRERLRWMLEDARPAAVVCERSLRAALPADGLALVTVELESAAAAIAQQPTAAPGVRIAGDDLAYVIFTSGSTGRPKGVELGHRGLANFLASMRKQPGIDASDTLLAVTTLSFDIAVLELFLPLTAGARVVIAPRQAALDGAALAALAEQCGATLMQATPVTWRLLLAAGWKGSPQLVILCGGEALQNDLARELLARCKRLWNMYGPTETTVWSLMHEVTQAAQGGVVPIGRPIDNTTAYILDARGMLAPIGVVGDLFLGGAGVARGYRGRDELTAERFLADPFASGARIYKTGDRARRRDDGVLEFLGRADNQVKLRGLRIELQEVEAVLSEHAQVHSSAVVVRDGASGDARLVAYVVPKGAALPPDLREWARTKLPEFMVPSNFVPLDALPLTPNGKVDRPALAARRDALPGESERFIAARDPIEAGLTRAFESVLGVTGIAVDRSFFDLGGHSLSAVALAQRIEKLLGRQVPVAAIFDAPTIEQLGALLRREGLPSAWRTLQPIQPAGTQPPLFFIGSIPFARTLVPYLGPDRPVYGLNFWSLVPRQGQEHAAALSVAGMARAYLDEVVTLQPKGPYYICAYCDDGLIAHEMASVLRSRGERVDFLGFIDCFRFIRRYAKYNLKNFISSIRAMGFSYLYLRAERRLRITRRGLQMARTRLLEKALAILGWNLAANHQDRLLFDAYLRALAAHKPQYFDGRLTLFASQELRQRFPDPTGDVIAAQIETIDIPGYHDQLFVPPQVEILGSTLRRRLEGDAT